MLGRKQRRCRKKENPLKRGRKPIEDIDMYEEDAREFKEYRLDLIKNCCVLTLKGRMKLKN